MRGCIILNCHSRNYAYGECTYHVRYKCQQREISLIFSGSAGDLQNITATVGISDFSTELHGFELAANLFALEYKPSNRIGIAVSFGQIEYVSLSGDAQEKNISIDSQTIGFRMNTSAVVGLRFYL